MVPNNNLIRRLSEVAEFVTEYDPEEAADITEGPLAELVGKYPGIEKFSQYISFLKMTGGAFASTSEFSLGIYGFEGHVVKSFDEGLFLDQDRFFLFADVMYPDMKNIIYFAFDITTREDSVFMSADEDPTYAICATSFEAWLSRFILGNYPKIG